jgi:hypothetical protein
MVHVSAFERLGKPVTTNKGKVLNAISSPKPYRPYNLISVIPYLAASYIRHADRLNLWHNIVQPIVTWKESRLVDWDGNSLDPTVQLDIERAFTLLPAPELIGVKTRPAEMQFILDPRPWSPPTPVGVKLAGKTSADKSP